MIAFLEDPVQLKPLNASLMTMLLTLCFCASAPAADEQRPTLPRVKVLFLGDNGHHQPLERCRQIYSTLAHRGVDLTYTDNLDQLNPKTLARYDCLLVFANIAAVSAEQEKAILDFVASGKGFAPIHSASACFGENPVLISLMGGRFASHGTAVFKEVIVEPEHPVMKGLHPIENWDETYVHDRHNEGERTVLSVRVEGDHREPYTWVRDHGKGRVFYTAWGHDERTWANEDFQNLLERGVRWAAGDWAMKPVEAPKPFEYVEANLPNYLPDQPWGTEGEAIAQMQQPVSPQQSMKHMVVPPGFSLHLFASEPDVMKPVALGWDERGRLWVAETFDYPNDLQPEGKGNDRITICEDTDGDGAADKFTRFADKLSIPTSLLPVSGGVIVAQAPHMLLLRDTDGDDKADERQVLFTGWGTADTHAGPSNLRWGFDNWIYGCVGYSGFEGAVGGAEMRFGQGAFRFKPDGSKLEFLGSTNNNTWGLSFSEDNHLFLSTANNNPSVYLGIPNRYYEQVRGLSPKGAPPIADTPSFFPSTSQVRQMEIHGSYTAAAGSAIYTARQFPPHYWNQVAFVTEPTGHLVGQFRLIPEGAGFRARNEFNLFSSGDEWTSPIAAEVGPDGAVWILDWYNYVIQHNPIPRGFDQGKGNAYVTPLRDKRHGRVLRMVYGDAGADYKPINLAGASTAELVEALKSDNMFWRMTAQRLLVEGKRKDARPALEKLVADPSVDQLGLNTAATHALWTLHGLGSTQGIDPPSAPVVMKALSHPSAAVRRAALDVMPRNDVAPHGLLRSNVLADPDAQVRKSALLALAEMRPTTGAGAAIFDILSRKENADDPILSDAAAFAASRHDADFLAAAFAAHRRTGDDATEETARGNLLPNPSFETVRDNAPDRWRSINWGGNASFRLVDEGRTGKRCVEIRSDAGADSTWSSEVKVQPNTDYRLSGWVKTQDVKNISGMGALFNIHEVQPQGRTAPVAGTSDWQRLEVTFNTGGRETVLVNCLFGGWGLSTGVAWYDDLELVPVASPALPGTLGKVVSIVCNQYAQRGPVDSVVSTLSSLKETDPQLASVIIDALAAGWPDGKAPKLAAADVKELQAVMAALPAAARDRLLVLGQRWGQHDLFAAAGREVMNKLSATLTNPGMEAASRIDAARRMLEVDGSPTTVGVILKQFNPQATPELQAGLIDALSLSEHPEVGRLVIERWKTITPAAQRAAIGVLLRREAWAASLLDAVEQGAVSNRDLAPEHWQVLTALPDEQLATRATALREATGRAPNADKQALLDKLLPLAKKPGDAEAGKQVFLKNCAVCHAIEGEGGKVGPDLTGVGAKPRDEILLEILDPNRSVEGTYRAWLVKTKNEVLSGRLSSESRTSIELLDTAGKSHAIQREDIVALKASDLSVMPEGFENLPPEDLTSLLEFLSQSKVKE